MSPENTPQMVDYSPTKLTINLILANCFAVLVLAVVAVPSLALYALRANIGTADLLKSFFGVGLLSNIILLILIIVGIFAHELIHGIFFSLYAKNRWKAISFGILMKYVTPYCHCSEPILLVQYVVAALAPTVVLGLVPIILSVVLVNPQLMVFGIIFVAAGSGDILLVFPLIQERGDCYVLDLQHEAGFLLYRRNG